MKRFLCLFLVLLLIGSVAVAEEASGIDLTGLTEEQLIALQEEVGAELYSRGGKIVFPEGELVVGRDIAAGSYTLTPYAGDPDYNGWAWTLNIWRSQESKGAYNQAIDEYNTLKWRADELVEEGKDAEYPPEVDKTQYLVFNDRFTNKNTQRITLEDGQMIEVLIWSLDSTLVMTIEKANGLFMD